MGPGFLGMAWAPFVVSSNGQVRNLEMGLDDKRLMQRMAALDLIEKGFIGQKRGAVGRRSPEDPQEDLDLMTSSRWKPSRSTKEPKEVLERYGNDGFGRGCLMARRLVEAGVPFVEVDLGGWDNHANIFTTLARTRSCRCSTRR